CVSRHPLTTFFFSFIAPATTEIYTLSLHDALPIFEPRGIELQVSRCGRRISDSGEPARDIDVVQEGPALRFWEIGQSNLAVVNRSEEHTSELQSRGHLVCRLLLEKKTTNHPRRKS